MKKINLKFNGHVMPAIYLWCLLMLFSPISQGSDEAAVAVVENLHAILLDNMKESDSKGYADRYNKISPFIENNFDTDLIVKVILSRYWSEFTDTQKNQFIDLFKQLTIATYASRFVNYANEKFVTNSVDQLKKGRLLVKTEIFSEDNNSTDNLDYLLHEKDGRWLIISVVANGVNDLSLKRAEYGTIIKDQGYDALVKEIQVKISQYESP